MLLWLSEYWPTILICAALLAVVTSIVVSLVKKKKKGGLSCGCGCSDCPMSGSCHTKK